MLQESFNSVTGPWAICLPSATTVYCKMCHRA